MFLVGNLCMNVIGIKAYSSLQSLTIHIGNTALYQNGPYKVNDQPKREDEIKNYGYESYH